jgi:hypothetical protein
MVIGTGEAPFVRHLQRHDDSLDRRRATVLSERLVDARASAAGAVGSSEAADRKFAAYSKGMKRKLTMAAGIVHSTASAVRSLISASAT